MEDVTQALTQPPFLAWVWRLVVWAASAYLLILGALMFIRPALVMRFFEGFAASRRINFLEAALRFIVGLAFMGASPDTKAPLLVFGFGAVLAATAIALAFLHDLHKRQAVWVIPLARRFLPLMGLVALALGALIAWVLI